MNQKNLILHDWGYIEKDLNSMWNKRSFLVEGVTDDLLKAIVLDVLNGPKQEIKLREPLIEGIEIKRLGRNNILVCVKISGTEVNELFEPKILTITTSSLHTLNFLFSYKDFTPIKAFEEFLTSPNQEIREYAKKELEK